MKTKNKSKTKMKAGNSDVIVIDLMETVSGTATSIEGVALYSVLDNALKKDKKVKLSLSKCTPISTSFLNSSFGEIYEKYGYKKIRSHITLVNYLPSYAMKIKEYLEALDTLVK